MPIFDIASASQQVGVKTMMEHQGGQRLAHGGMSNTFAAPQTYQARPRPLFPLQTQGIVHRAIHCRACMMAHLDPQHSFFFDEFYHHRDEHAIYEEVAHQPLVQHPAQPSYAFRPLLSTEPIPSAFPVAPDPVVKVDNSPQLQVPGVLSRPVEARQYSQISDDDWARASIDYEAHSPDSVETDADSPLTPGADGNGTFTNYLLSSGRAGNNIVAAAFYHAQQYDTKPFVPSLPQSAAPAPFVMPGQYHQHAHISGSYDTHQPAYTAPVYQGGVGLGIQANVLPAHAFIAPHTGGSISAGSSFQEEAVSEYSSSDEQSPGSGQPRTLPATRVSERDELILELWRQKVPYKEIKRRTRFPGAESTLRGRIRVLTTKKEHRVRKPVWTAEDDELLRLAVDLFTPDNPRPSFKIPWMKLAAWMKENGASYPFGVQAVSKHWNEIS